MNAMEIYYFTGTGNSMFAAKEMYKRFQDASLIPVLSLLNTKKIKPEAKIVGFVFPIYQTTLPIPVRKLLRRMSFENTAYIFAIATRIGTTHSAFGEIDRILKKQGRQLDLYYSLNMPSNDPKFDYEVPTQDRIKELEETALQELDRLSGIIGRMEANRGKDDNCATRIPFVSILSYLVKLTEGHFLNFYHDEKCSGCGICEKVCTSGKIKMLNGLPVWQTAVECYKCSACLNYCPLQSVQLKSFTEKNGRYSHPYAEVEDIEAQRKNKEGLRQDE